MSISTTPRAESPSTDFFDILENKAEFIGRDLVVADSLARTTYRGPITEIKKPQSSSQNNPLVIIVGWRASRPFDGEKQDWRLAKDEPFRYSIELSRTTFRLDEDGSLAIKEYRGLDATILPADATSLVKPTS